MQESQLKTEVWNERAPGLAPGALSPRSSPRAAKTMSSLLEAVKTWKSHVEMVINPGKL